MTGGTINYRLNESTEEEVREHLLCCDHQFRPQLSERVNIPDYARKIRGKAYTFEAWDHVNLVGLIAAYTNTKERSCFITSVSVLMAYSGRGIAAKLLSACLDSANSENIATVYLEVSEDNYPAISLYKKFGFRLIEVRDGTLLMRRDHISILRLPKRFSHMNTKRDFNQEIKDTNDHNYAYSFDFDVMHPYMLKSFLPFFRQGNLLELGSFKGDFTKKILPYFDDITCVEASDEAIALAQDKLGNNVKFVNSRIETVELSTTYNNIVLTHVLEHLEDPVLVLKRINKQWLSQSGRLFLVCPNANAPSRQIAVKMGLISHNAAVTPAEAEHGHQCTYSLDTLERDAVEAGLKVVHRSGIFFKALANFQWDRLLLTDIISREYLEGCFMLGQQYPDLCSSIFLLCEKGEK